MQSGSPTHFCQRRESAIKVPCTAEETRNGTRRYTSGDETTLIAAPTTVYFVATLVLIIRSTGSKYAISYSKDSRIQCFQSVTKAVIPPFDDWRSTSRRTENIGLKDGQILLEQICARMLPVPLKGRKRHILVDTLGLPIACRVEPANISDRRVASLLLGGLGPLFPDIRTS